MYKRITKFLPWLLFASVLLRSLVAAGYEFANVDENGEFSFGIVWCPGLNNIYALDTEDDHDHDHDHDQLPEDSSSEHFTATCDLWTGNTSFVNNQLNISAGLLILQPKWHTSVYVNVIPLTFFNRNHPTRAPPFEYL